MGGSIVRVSAKITAWYPDGAASRSGYQLLTSNGRLESDLLDQLTDLLGPGASDKPDEASGPNFPVDSPPNSSLNSAPSSSAAKASRPAGATATDKKMASAGKAEPAISAPMARSPEADRVFTSSAAPGLSGRQLAETKNASPKPANPTEANLQAEAASLEEVLKNQAHPKNLVAIKKSGTPVVSTPSLTAKTLFLASAQDEFEMLDFNADWVHVRISGLSRGWIWRTSLEMPEGISDIPKRPPAALRPLLTYFR